MPPRSDPAAAYHARFARDPFPTPFPQKSARPTSESFMLLRADQLARSFSHRPLFAHVTLSIVEGERVGLIGPNGSGKSTLLKILAGIEDPDAGTCTRKRSLRTAYVPQREELSAAMSVVDAVEAAAKDAGVDGHVLHERAMMCARQVGFGDLDQQVGTLSGGWLRRLSIARGLVAAPDLLLLDEPTNHLDLEGITWLEDLLRRAEFASIFVTHDRFFLERVATRIIELSHSYPDGTFSVKGGYDEFLRRRDEFLHAQKREQQTLANQVREDIKWLSRGAQARRTKSRSRIQDASQRMDHLSALKERNRDAQAAGVEFQSSDRRSRRLLIAEGLAKSLGGRKLFEGVDIELGPGDCLGLLGPNGSGKTTLLRVLTGELEADAGTVKRADDLKLVMFSQHREALNLRQTLREALAPHGDTVHVMGRPMHVVTWAQRFLFRPEQLPSPVGQLSGGEQARLLIAQLMLEPADLLVLDEPTNDLDIPTLEVLERSLEEFPGAIILVTHDRFMLQRLATEVLGLDGMGGARHHADYFQWEEAQRKGGGGPASSAGRSPAAATGWSAPPAASSGAAPAASAAPTSADIRRSLTWKEQQEWDRMESAIAAAEAAAEAARTRVGDPEVMADANAMHEACRALEAADAEVERLYARWAALEAKGVKQG